MFKRIGKQMNDQDKEAFEKWCTEKFNIAPELVKEFKHTFIHKLRHTEEAWQSACEYKQKVIDELESENAKLNLEIEKFKSYLEAFKKKSAKDNTGLDWDNIL